jgi:hypothetical protein
MKVSERLACARHEMRCARSRCVVPFAAKSAIGKQRQCDLSLGGGMKRLKSNSGEEHQISAASRNEIR